MPDQLARMIRLRDQRCRTRWCDAPIRQSDHIRAVAEGGETSQPNGQGLCEACNRAKQAPGWRARPSPDARHTVETTTPTGHSYVSTAPALIRSRFIRTSPGVWTLVA
jgi:5-methylcytosine-specific restriction endonuclease McrA